MVVCTENEPSEMMNEDVEEIFKMSLNLSNVYLPILL